MARFRFKPIALAALMLNAPGTRAEAVPPGEISGPVQADVIRVIDGDTVLVSAQPWPQQRVEVYVRLRGIDTPELKAKCKATQEAARRAQQRLAELLDGEPAILLTRISADKYFSRIIADIALEDGRNPAQDMLDGGYATPYDGGHKPPSCRTSW